MKTLIIALITLAREVGVEWDRFTQTDDGFFIVYGWIARSDGQRDFVEITYEISEIDSIWYCTSSAKYSHKIHELLYGEIEGHTECRKVEELFAMAEHYGYGEKTPD